MERRLITLSAVVVILVLTVSASDDPSLIPEGISVSVEDGDCKELAKFFNNNIELVIIDSEDVYSKSQAELIMKDFFSKYPPDDFDILHEGGREASRYAIGKLVSGDNVFRVYFLLNKVEDELKIHQMRIEYDEDG